MTLIEPAWVTFWNKYRTYLVVGGLGLLLIGVALFLYDCGEGAWFKSKVQKQKDAIASDADKIASATNQIVELEKTKVAAQSNINAATEQLNKDLFGRDEVKAEANQALANFQKSVNANLDVNRSADDLIKILEKLDNE